MKTPIIHRKNFHSFCRTCLKEIAKHSLKVQKYNIHQTPNLLKWINVCTPWDTNKKDEYPKFVCEECYTKLQSLHEFREMSIKSKQTLDSIWNEVKSEPEIEFETITKNPETETQDQNLNADNQNKVWLDFEADDKSLIIPTFENMSENIKKDVKVNETETSKENLEDLKLFEYKNCAENSFEKNIENLENATDFLEVGINVNTIDDIDIIPSEEIMKTENSTFDGVPKTIKIPKGSLQCSSCPRFFYKQEKLDIHLRVHQGLKAYQCNQCNRGYSKKYRLKLHISRDHDNTYNEEIVCAIDGCGVKCRNSESHHTHIRRKHSNHPSILTMVICEDCGLSFKTNASLKKHRFKHGPPEAYPFNCDQCGKCFPTKYKYKQHMDRHAGIKNFECPFCGLKKTTNDELRTHMNFHTKERQWPCAHCTSTFNSSGNLGRHVRVVHKGIRRFVCKYCAQTFGKAESLKHHEMRHTGEKPHQCQTCDKRFIQKTALQTHMKTHARTCN